MAKILLVDPPWYIFQGIKTDSFSLGLTYIATVLKENGHDCLIYNGDFTTNTLAGQERVLVDYKNYLNEITLKSSSVWTEFNELLKEFDPDYVGISMHTAKYGSALEIAGIVKNHNSNIPVFVGGVHPTIQPAETLKESCFDIAVVGEGDRIAVELIKALESNADLSSVKGIYYKKNCAILQNPPQQLIEDIDNIPFPDFTLYHKFDKYPPGYLNRVLTSRGCPFECIYCASNKLWGRKVRFRAPEKVFEEIIYRHKKFGVKFFKFNDDTFTLNLQRFEKLCALIITSKLKIKWMCDTRADKLNEKILKMMKKAGCRQVNIGVESGSEKILKFMKKGESLETIKKAFILTKKFKITTVAYFMMGFPHETKEDILESIKVMRQIKPDTVCWSLLTPYPGTMFYNYLIENNLLTITPNWSHFFHHSPEMNFSKHISNSEWAKIIKLVDNTILDYYRELAIEKFLSNPIESIFERLSIYRQTPALILKNLTLFPQIYRGVLNKLK